ncbi:hypothetical protein POM88_037190 [Heracleum sosnowskyi]|uniref:Aldehyde dehydrogenase domain-containing protein n=1 Tax=Heracleum sosnowskyi TaxID=360622 RepID=A0AAD8HRG0_9APIA|nr:hypothetical protein POM88_037190 [Heracleum sosnowskyi]
MRIEVAVSRIISGKWGCNNGQACKAPDYIITTKDFALKLVDSLKLHLIKFYGEEPLKSNDISRIVNLNHFNHLIKLLDDDKVSDKIVHGGQTDIKNLKIAPTILLDVPDNSLIMSDEIHICLLKNSCELAIKELKCWMKPEKVGTTLLTFPSTTGIVAEPFGVVLIVATWNFPLLVSLNPVIGAIAAGNTVVLKPSEVSPTMCALLANYVGEYMDSSAVKVVEGDIPETSALLEQKWDKILYTGSFSISLMSVFPYEISQS